MGRFPEYVRAQVPQTKFYLIRFEDVLEHGHAPETKCRAVAGWSLGFGDMREYKNKIVFTDLGSEIVVAFVTII